MTDKLTTKSVTDVLGLGKLANALALPILILVIGYLNGCP